MSLAFWLSLAVFVAIAAVSLEVAFGWRKIPHLKDVEPAPASEQPRVSIIVSALNEADTIEPALRSLLSIDYPDLEVIIVDDRSTDATPAIIDAIAATRPQLRVIHVTELPNGWLGKNHALQRGAHIASGEYLLFTDADAVFEPSVVSRAVAYCEKHRVDHLTLLFELVAHTQLLRMLLLSFGVGFMARFKPWKVARSRTHYIGVGGFNMVRRSAYFDTGGHAAIPLAVLDDLMLGKLIKTSGHRQRILLGDGMVTIEWYRGTAELIRGLEKNIFTAFDYRLLGLFAVSLLVLATRVWPWFALIIARGPVWWVNAATIGVTLALYIDLLRVRGWAYRCLAFAPLVPLLELLIWWRGSLLAVARNGIEWRGTRYRLSELRRAHHALAARSGDGRGK